jgi:two-component system OmpR family sensor kinase
VNPLRSVGARLSLALLAVLTGALAFVYLIVVPSLERNLISAKLHQLETAAPTVAAGLPSDDILIPDFVVTSSGTANARVVVYEPISTSGAVLRLVGDSNPVESSDVDNDPIAVRALETLGPAHGVVTHKGRRYAEAAALTVPDLHVVLLRAPLADSLGNVSLVRHRLLIAVLLALAASLIIGYGAASAFARRIRRLEQAAERIAAGDFDEPVVDPRGDELGQLAAAFERMRQRLAQLDHARREFIANASHELRTPLFSLGGFLELMSDEELDEPTRAEFLETMREQVARLTKLATDLLDLSRLDAGRLTVVREHVDLGEVATALGEEFRALAHAGDHALEVRAGAEMPALADEDRVFQIGRTLVENALRHTPPGTRVRIEAGRRGADAALTVVDDGPGIPEEHAQQVFERFYRIEGAIASGSGLGLAIARELAELMDGTIELRSRPGRTTFTLRLPAAEAAPAPAVSPEPVGA